MVFYNPSLLKNKIKKKNPYTNSNERNWDKRGCLRGEAVKPTKLQRKMRKRGICLA